MDSVKIVVMNLDVDFLDEFPGSFKTIDVSKFILEMTKEGFFVAILPGRCLGRNRNLHTLEFEIVSHHASHELFSLIGVEIYRHVAGNEDSLFNHGDNECCVVEFAHIGGKDLASCQILNRCQIPKLSLKFEVRHITDPDEMR